MAPSHARSPAARSPQSRSRSPAAKRTPSRTSKSASSRSRSPAANRTPSRTSKSASSRSRSPAKQNATENLENSSRSSWTYFLVGALAVGVVALSYKTKSFLSDPTSAAYAEENMRAGLDAIRKLGIAGMVLMAAVEIVAVAVCLAPVAFAIELSAGSIYGIAKGVMLVSAAKCTAASLTFILGRTVLQHKVAAWSRSSPKFASLQKMASKEGWQLVLLMRISPAPAFVANYGFALTDISFTTYAITTFFATLAPITQNVMFGEAVSDVVTHVFNKLSGKPMPASSGPPQSEFWWFFNKACLVASVMVAAWVTQKMFSALASSEDRSSARPQRRRRQNPKQE